MFRKAMKVKISNVKSLLLLTFSFLYSGSIEAQKDSSWSESQSTPIPIEIVVGDKAGSYQSVISKTLYNSKFSFYNLTYLEVDYEDNTPHYYYIQTMVNYKLFGGFSAGLGANLQSFNELKPLAAVSYGYFSRSIGFYIQPSYELHKNGSFELYAMFEWIGENSKKIQPYFKISAYTAWQSEHIYSYHFWRAGINYKDFRIGPAVNAQYYGKNGNAKYNFGGFINVLIQ